MSPESAERPASIVVFGSFNIDVALRLDRSVSPPPGCHRRIENLEARVHDMSAP